MLSPRFYKVTLGIHISVTTWYTKKVIKGENVLIYGGIGDEKFLALGQ